MITPNEIKPQGHPLMVRIKERFPKNTFDYFKPNENLQSKTKLSELFGVHWFLIIDGNLTKIILTEDFLEAYYIDSEKKGFNDTAFEMMVQKIESYL